VGAAGALLLLPTGEPQPLDLSFPSAWATLLDFSWLWRARPRKRPEPGPGGLIERDYLSGACLMTRREVVAQIGGLDEGYFLFFEDTDWCWRMHQGGWRVVEVPAAQVVHHVGRAGATSDLIRRGWNYHGLHRFFRLHRRREAHWALSRGLRVLCGAKLSLLWILERTGRIPPPEAAARRAFLRRVLEATRQAA
jgi:GT2 family glycosyltransferase